MNITLRKEKAEDEPFLREVYACTRAYEMSLVPWNEAQKQAFVGMQFEAQRAHYHAESPDAAYDLVLLDGEPIGRLFVARETEAIRILDLTILPAFRGRGVGTFLLKGLIDEAEKSARVLTIYVEQFNPSLSLFRRLGFKEVLADGVNTLLEFASSRAAKIPK